MVYFTFLATTDIRKGDLLRIDGDTAGVLETNEKWSGGVGIAVTDAKQGESVRVTLQGAATLRIPNNAPPYWIHPDDDKTAG